MNIRNKNTQLTGYNKGYRKSCRTSIAIILVQDKIWQKKGRVKVIDKKLNEQMSSASIHILRLEAASAARSAA